MPPALRHDWTRDEVVALMALPFPELMHRAGQMHRQVFDPCQVQVSTLLSIKTGAVPRSAPTVRKRALNTVEAHSCSRSRSV